MSSERHGTRSKVFVSRRIPDLGLVPIREETNATIFGGEYGPSRSELLTAVQGCHGVVTLVGDRVDAELLDRAGPSLKVISNYGVGFDHIDVAECTRRGIPVGNTPGVLTETTADLAWALLMASARRVVEGVEFVKAGKWKAWGPMLLLGSDIHDSTLGIVGLGRIGQAVARRAAGFGMKVLYSNRSDVPRSIEDELHVTRVSLDELLKLSDYVSLHVTLADTTRKLIKARELRLMKESAILINTSRGPVVDTNALLDALTGGTIAGAALDVTEPEPIPPDHPLVGLQNCLIVPHIASASVTTRGKMAAMAAANLLAGLRGERLPTPVNAELYG